MYFITVCVQDKVCVFGNVVDGKMEVNDAGRIAHNEWLKTAELRKNVQLHNFIVMPNHFHTIFEITHPVGAYCIRPDEIRSADEMIDNHVHLDVAQMGVMAGNQMGEMSGNQMGMMADNQMDVMRGNQMDVMHGNQKGVCNTPLRSPSQTVGAIIRGYKSAVTRQMNVLGIPFKWQRDMYEHIIRDYGDYARIDEYILNNPAKWKSDRFYNN